MCLSLSFFVILVTPGKIRSDNINTFQPHQLFRCLTQFMCSSEKAYVHIYDIMLIYCNRKATV